MNFSCLVCKVSSSNIADFDVVFHCQIMCKALVMSSQIWSQVCYCYVMSAAYTGCATVIVETGLFPWQLKRWRSCRIVNQDHAVFKKSLQLTVDFFSMGGFESWCPLVAAASASSGDHETFMLNSHWSASTDQ